MGIQIKINLSDILGSDGVKDTLKMILPKKLVDQLEDILNGLEICIKKPLFDTGYKLVFESREENGEHIFEIDIPFGIFESEKMKEVIMASKDKLIEKFVEKLKPDSSS